MYRGGGNGSKLETVSLDQKRIDDALDKHLEKSTLSTSRGMIGKDKDRFTVMVPSPASGNQPEHRSLSKNKASGGDMFTEEQNELVESAAEMLYVLIHVRCILTSKGMAAMLEKFKNYDLGRCPRVYCCGQLCLPFEQSDIPRSSTVKTYCPKCEDVYYPRSK